MFSITRHFAALSDRIHIHCRIIVYLKMFMGMGFFWALEITAGLLQEGSSHPIW